MLKIVPFFFFSHFKKSESSLNNIVSNYYNKIEVRKNVFKTFYNAEQENDVFVYFAGY